MDVTQRTLSKREASQAMAHSRQLIREIADLIRSQPMDYRTHRPARLTPRRSNCRHDKVDRGRT